MNHVSEETRNAHEALVFSSKGSTSIALCTYNGEKFLQEQLESFSEQSQLPYELIVCDDRSQDGTLKILQDFAKRAKFPVRVFVNPAQLRSTRNFDQAIRLCSGKYIALSDQDDRWKPAKLERLASIMDQDAGVGMVFSDADLIDDTSSPMGATLWQSLRFRPRARSIFETDPGKVLLQRPVVTGATMIFRRSLLDRFSSIPASWVHDGWITWMSVLWSRPIAVAESLTDYRIHSAQQLGVGKTSFLARMNEIRQKQRRQYGNVAIEFEDLANYVQQASPEIKERWSDSLQQAIHFLRARAEAPATVQGRLLFLLRHFPAYQNLSGPGWRSLLRDLFMGEAPEAKQPGSRA